MRASGREGDIDPQDDPLTSDSEPFGTIYTLQRLMIRVPLPLRRVVNTALRELAERLRQSARDLTPRALRDSGRDALRGNLR